MPRVQPDRNRSTLRNPFDWHGTRDVETLETAGLNHNRMSFPTVPMR